MKKYKLRFLPLFEEDLNRIVDYISLQLENLVAAYSLVDDIHEAINKRLPFAESFEIYPL
jgi:toxin ParE1/3/4